MPRRVRRVDETAEIVRRAIETRGRKGIDAVVAPAEFAGKFVHRHDLEYADADIGQRRQFRDCRRPGALARERSDVHLVKHLAADGDAFPARILPAVGMRVDDLRKPMWTAGLKARGRVGIAVLSIEAVLVEGTH